MKLYDYAGAPNPRRVKIFAAEKGIELDLVQTDMGKREHKTDDFIAKNPSGKIPVLELDDGTCIGESIAICRYLEAICPEPNLFGSTAVEAAIIEMHHRHIELELFSQVGTSWVNGPIVGKLFEGQIVQIPQAKDRSDGLTHEYYQRLDKAFGENEYVAG
ncbi:MAG: glutathione S-transferase, partial [Limisphaerales bacterium]